MTDPKDRKLPLSALAGATYSIATDLPPHIYEGIGKIISAHAILETQVSELVFELMKINYPEGRVALRYQAASERFKIARRLLDLHGITAQVNTKQLLDQITGCCEARDQFSHGVWILKEGILALRHTRGEYETPEGRGDRSFLPEAQIVDDTYYEEVRTTILITANVVQELKKHVKPLLQKPPAKS